MPPAPDALSVNFKCEPLPLEFLIEVVLKKFTLLFLRLKLPFVPNCSGIPTLKFILPLNPNRSCFFRNYFS